MHNKATRACFWYNSLYTYNNGIKDLIINYAYNYVYISKFYNLYSKGTWLDYILPASSLYFLFTPARISLCILSDDGLTSSAFQWLPANLVQVVASGRCWPNAADEEWLYYNKYFEFKKLVGRQRP